MRKRLRAIANHPITPMVLAIVLGLDLWCLFSRVTQYPTLTQKVLQQTFGPSIKWNFSMYAGYTIERDDGTIEMIRDIEWRVDPHTGREPNIVESLSIAHSRIPRGLYAPTWRTHSTTFHIVKYRQDVPEEAVALREEFVRQSMAVGYLPRDFSQQNIAKLLESGVVRRTEWLPLGHLHNAMSFAAFALLCWSLRLNIPKLWRRRTDPTECPHCRYSAIGLTTNTCPECGRPLSSSSG